MSSKSSSQHRKRTGNFAAMLTLVAISTILIGSGFYGPHWSFDYSTLSYEVRDTILKIERFEAKDMVQPVSAEVIDAQRQRQNWIIANATHNELQALLDYPHAGIKLIAYKALLDCHDIDHYALLKRALDQDSHATLFMPSQTATNTVDSQYTTVATYLVNEVSDDLSNTYNLTKTQIREIVAKRNQITSR